MSIAIFYVRTQILDIVAWQNASTPKHLIMLQLHACILIATTVYDYFTTTLFWLITATNYLFVTTLTFEKYFIPLKCGYDFSWLEKKKISSLVGDTQYMTVIDFKWDVMLISDWLLSMKYVTRLIENKKYFHEKWKLLSIWFFELD